ncbi:hypothetical protein J6590_086399 [Homalodisca vitripennis]|nr:hypothetical protein J6590_086399 [Homalodisca vitripennis]
MDKVLQNVCNNQVKPLVSPACDKRKGRRAHNKTDHSVIQSHIESFEPTIAHYRREHAPNRRPHYYVDRLLSPQGGKSLHAMKKIHDFNDFKAAVEKSTTNVSVLEMKLEHFYKWKDFSYTRKKEDPRP